MLRSNKIFPSFYVIEISSLCNLKCSICPQKAMKDKHKGLMNMTTYKKLLSKIKKYAKCILLYWMGEPLLNKNLIDIIKITKKMTNAKIIISTNGLLLNKDIIVGLIDSKLDELIFSVDATNSKTYEKIRVGGDYNELEKNILLILKYKKVYNSQLKIRLQFIKTRLNSNEICEFIEKWKNYDCFTEISPLYDWANQMPELKEEDAHTTSIKRDACSDLWYKMCIRVNGDVSLCCFDYANTICLGSLLKQSVKKIWNSPILQNIRKSHFESKFEGICLKCDAWATPNEYKEFL